MITIYTSYWAYLTNIPRNKYYIVQVSNSRPKGVHQTDIDAIWYAAMPDYNTMVKAYHEKQIDADQYSKMYESILSSRKEQIKNEYKSLFATAKQLGKELIFICWEKPTDYCHRTQLANFFVSQWPKDFTHVEYKATNKGKYAPCRIHITYRQGTTPYKVNGKLIDQYVTTANPEEYINRALETHTANGYAAEPIRDCIIDGQRVFLSKTFHKGSFTITYRNANQNAPKFAYQFHIRNEQKKVFSCQDIEKTLSHLHKNITAKQADANETFTGKYTLFESKTIKNGKPVLHAEGHY